LSRPALLVILCAALALPAAGQSRRPDWDAFAGVDTIEVITHDADGEPRETTIWLAVVDGQGFIRTGDTTWGENVVRDPNVVLRIEGEEYPLRADLIEDEGLRERVERTFHDKYGWQDRFVGWLRPGETKIMHMLSR
jgi:hypothetical protein